MLSSFLTPPPPHQTCNRHDVSADLSEKSGLLLVCAGSVGSRGRKEERGEGAWWWCMCFYFSVHVKAVLKLVVIYWNVLLTTPS